MRSDFSIELCLDAVVFSGWLRDYYAPLPYLFQITLPWIGSSTTAEAAKMTTVEKRLLHALQKLRLLIEFKG
jgi:hypothetical protein